MGTLIRCMAQPIALRGPQIGSKSSDYVEEYLDANERVESVCPISAKKWLPPPPNCVKLNVAWKKHTNRTSFDVGSVIHDDACLVGCSL
jgi:hypothetical protein